MHAPSVETARIPRPGSTNGTLFRFTAWRQAVARAVHSDFASTPSLEVSGCLRAFKSMRQLEAGYT